MRLAPIALAIAVLGIPLSLQAAKPIKKKVVHSSVRVHKARRQSVAKARPVEVADETSARVPANPMPPIPAISSTGPATLVHLERLLPASADASVPVKKAYRTASPAPLTSQDLAPVLSQGTGLEYESEVAANLGFEPADPNHLDFLWPVETRSISSAWGPRIRSKVVQVKSAAKRRQVRMKYSSTHKGVDLTAPIGTDVYAAMDGRVVTAAKHRQYGNYVMIDHGNGVETLYAHNSKLLVEVGDIVRKGQKIAEVGRTGNATGPHVHFEVRLQGLAQNPLPMLNDTEEIPTEMMALNGSAPESAQ
jgi:murein DD-endopeptidase MepM/ murein hydrolase activator NlpD